jgi:hypothetical protein
MVVGLTVCLWAVGNIVIAEGKPVEKEAKEFGEDLNLEDRTMLFWSVGFGFAIYGVLRFIIDMTKWCRQRWFGKKTVLSEKLIKVFPVYTQVDETLCPPFPAGRVVTERKLHRDAKCWQMQTARKSKKVVKFIGLCGTCFPDQKTD